MKKFLLLNLLLSPLFFISVIAQDIHLSHINAGPLLYNPAMTGLFNADMRFIANYKSQWKSIGTDYQTCYASAEMKTRRLFKSTSAMGFGLEIFSDKAGDLDYSQQGAQLNFSGIKLMDGYNGKKLFSGGFKAGYVMNSFDPTKIIAFDEEIALQKDAKTNTGYFDLSAGLAWMHQLDNEKHSYYLGASMSHINKPVITYNLAGTEAVGNQLYRKMIVHAGGHFTLKNKVSIQPTFLFMDQGPNREITVGSFISYNMKTQNTRSRNDSNFSLQIGAWVRTYWETDVRGIDAIILSAKANIEDTSFTFSYDMNISSLTPATVGRGGPELSIIQLINFKNAPNKSIQCPSFY